MDVGKALKFWDGMRKFPSNAESYIAIYTIFARTLSILSGVILIVA